MAGAFSSATMREFVATVNLVFPGTDCLTVDIVPSDKPENSELCRFVQLNACELPYKDTFDSIHTSGLLDFLGETGVDEEDSSVLQ